MARAPSHAEREGAAPPAGTRGEAAPVSPRPIARRSQGIDYGEDSDVAQLHAPVILERKTVTIVSGPISLWALALWGLVLFLIGFFHGREISNFGSSGAVESSSREMTAAAPTPAATATPASAPGQPTAAAPGQVIIKLLKYSPQTIEIGKGETVEWANNDLTPHTVTSQDGGGELNSGSIDAGASWRHTFNQPGTFSYFCTFHPEMKGTVTVK